MFILVNFCDPPFSVKFSGVVKSYIQCNDGTKDNLEEVFLSNLSHCNPQNKDRERNLRGGMYWVAPINLENLPFCGAKSAVLPINLMETRLATEYISTI